MRSWVVVLAGLAWGCGKSGPGSTVLEQCSNGIDDDGNGSTDCEDPACGCDTSDTGFGGTTPTTTFTGTTGVTNTASPLSIVVDPTIALWQHEVGLTECPQPLGRILIDNTTAEPAQIVVSSVRRDGEDVFHFELEGQTAIAPWVDWPLPAQTAGVVWVYYACTADSSFIHPIDVDFHTTPLPSTESNAATILSQGTIL